MIASESSIAEYKKIGVDVITTISLDERNKCYCDNSDIFHFYPNYIVTC